VGFWVLTPCRLKIGIIVSEEHTASIFGVKGAHTVVAVVFRVLAGKVV
jgi:hypothetical protein